jgi:hypothetical protein
MQHWRGPLIAIAMILMVGVSGCLDRLYEKPVPVPTSTPLPVITPAPENPGSTTGPSEMALQLADLPTDYFIRDRSVIAYDEVPKLNRDLGWRQGYFVSFYRMNLRNEDLTGITQTIGIYPLEEMNPLYAIEKDALLSHDTSVEQYEIPFPIVGDRSFAIRETRPDEPYAGVRYTVIFTRKNVFEKITMGGTTTDYETLKDVANKAAARIR